MAADLLSKQQLIANTTTVDSSNNPITIALYPLKTEGDGNCGLNLFAQKMREFAELEQLHLIFKKEAEFIAFRRHLLASLPTLKKKIAANPYIAEFVGLLTQNKNATLQDFSRFLKKAKTVRQIQELQFALAPALRSFMVESYKRPNNLTELAERESLSQSGVYAPDDALTSLATRLHLKINIVEQQEVQKSVSANQQSAFITSQRNNLPNSNPDIYIIHTGGDSLSAHWTLGVPATQKSQVAFWESISVQQAPITKRLNELEQQVNELAVNVIEALNKKTDWPLTLKGELIDPLALQESLIDHLLKKIPDIYQNIESKINAAMAHLYSQPHMPTTHSADVIDDYITNIYQQTIAPYAQLLEPTPSSIDAVIEQLYSECNVAVSASGMQQAFARDTTGTPPLPLGSPAKVSPGQSRFGLNTPKTCCSMDTGSIAQLNALHSPSAKS